MYLSKNIFRDPVTIIIMVLLFIFLVMIFIPQNLLVNISDSFFK